MVVMATAKQFHFVLVLIHFLLALTDSRYIANKKTENELSNEKAPKHTLDDDVDLETFLEDYYDELWQYLETWDRDPGKTKKKKKEDVEKEDIKKEDVKKEKVNFGDYDYMSDMPAGQPEVDGKKSKNWEKDLEVAEKENLTWPNAENPAVNGTSNDGIPEVIRANRESNSQEEYPLRSKQMRLMSIIEQVLSFRGGNPKLNQTIPDAKQYNALKEIYEKNIRRIKNDEWGSSDTEKVESFYPSCDIPRNTEEDVWSDPNSMNLLFDLHYPAPQEDNTIEIITAKLRLYKLPQENYSVPSMESSTAKVKWERNQNGFGGLPADDDRQIRVSVYWYTRSLRRHRVKKKLLDSQMLSLYGARWTEFNIRSAVRTWKESGKNFGLVVNVEDEDGVLLPAEQFIQSMNCSKWTATVRPIPSIIMDRVNQYFIDNPAEDRNETYDDLKSDEDRHKIYPYQPYLYPKIDLRTREVPNSDFTPESRVVNLSRRGFNVTNESIVNFLKKNNLDLREITKLSRVDKSLPRKSETRIGEPRVNNFQNVPIGSPSRGFLEEADPREAESEGGEEKEMPRIRHNRKQWDLIQKSTSSSFLSRVDFNATDHH